MSVGKVVLLVLYAVLVVLAITQAGTQTGTIVNWIVLGLVVVHTFEVVLFFRLCRDAEGPLPGHLLKVLLFGALHVKDLKAAQ